MLDDFGEEDPFLRGWQETDKPAILCLFLSGRHEEGLRGKQATAVTAGVRYHFMKAHVPATFMESTIMTAARTACRPSAAELRKKKDQGPRPAVKVALCESALMKMRAVLWEGRGWGVADIDKRMSYIGCLYGYDMSARVSEYTANEVGHEDHCVRAGDILFEMRDGRKVIGGSDYFRGAAIDLAGQVQGCWVQSASHKTGTRVKAKFIGRRSVEEAQFLEDLFEWNARSGVNSADRLLTRYLTSVEGTTTVKHLTGRMVRDEVKAAAELEGLDPLFFSSHSLRKAAITHMRTQGVTDTDMRDRANYAAGSEVMSMSYDYSTAGQGPLSSNSLTTGRRHGVEDVRRYLPQAADLGVLGEGDHCPPLTIHGTQER